MIANKVSLKKMRALDRLRLGCLVPYLRRPFEPIFEELRCALGISNEGFMEAPSNCLSCTEPTKENRTITHDLGLPNLDSEMLNVATLDNCYTNMPAVMYGARVLVKNIDDQDCEDPKYSEMCQELEQAGRILMEEECSMPG